MNYNSDITIREIPTDFDLPIGVFFQSTCNKYLIYIFLGRDGERIKFKPYAYITTRLLDDYIIIDSSISYLLINDGHICSSHLPDNVFLVTTHTLNINRNEMIDKILEV
jgi:hypothetical protein